MTRALKWLFAVFAILLLGLSAYETFRALRARDETTGLISGVLAKADPQIMHVPADRIAMLLAVEDPTFWTNDGTDFFSRGAGTTTLTQSLAKGLYFPSGFHPGFEKIELILIAKFALIRRRALQRESRINRPQKLCCSS